VAFYPVAPTIGNISPPLPAADGGTGQTSLPLTVANGGTGAANSLAALQALDGMVQAATYTQLGIVAWNYPSYLVSVSGTALATAGTIYLVRVPMFGASATVTNILCAVTTAGGTLTSAENFIGLYDNNANLIGTSADQTTAWGTTGFKTAALTGGPFTGSWPFVFAGLVFNGTTGPGFLRGVGTGAGPGAPASVVLNATGSNLPCATIMTGQTSLPSSLTGGYAAASGTTSTPQAIWVGLS
jgi:hypothetical protein